MFGLPALAGQALSALWYLGRRQVAPATFERIAAKLPQVEFEALRSAKASMPAWMLEALRRYEEDTVAAHVGGRLNGAGLKKPGDPP